VEQIAGHLDLSEKTVEFHKTSHHGNLHLKSNSDLVLFALKQGLISMDSKSSQQTLSS
jgi:DNA-binding NarL/FixJ family response regulator